MKKIIAAIVIALAIIGLCIGGYYMFNKNPNIAETESVSVVTEIPVVTEITLTSAE